MIYRQINSAADHTILQQDLHKLARWEAEYSMEFHPEKCNVLRVTRSRSPSIVNYTLHGTNLKSTESTKYLGVTLTKDLTWGKHIDIIRAKANQQLAFVRRNIRTRSSSTKEKLFNTICCDCLGPAHLQAETLARDGTTKSCEMGNQQTSQYIKCHRHAPHTRLDIPRTPPCYQQTVYAIPDLPWFYWHPT